MSDILTFGLSQINDLFIISSGGNLLLIGLVPVLITALLLWSAKASLPVSALIVFTELGILSVTLNNPGDPLFGGSTDIGALGMLYLLVVAMTGFLIYHFLFKRTQMG